jgi:hypothetical protein
MVRFALFMKLIFSYLSKVLVIFFLVLSYVLPAQTQPSLPIIHEEYISLHHNSNGENLFSDILLDISVDDDDIHDSKSEIFPVVETIFDDLSMVVLHYADYYITKVRTSEFFIQHHLSLYIFHCVFRL